LRLGGDVVIDWREHIAVDPAVLVGKPVVRGTRLAVEFILGLVAEGWGFDAILANYPGLTVEDVRACVAYARDIVTEKRALPEPP
jgi:uncharacterized protein (DUF433 family)